MSKLKSRVINVNNRRTSVRMCNTEWCAFDDLCKREKISRKKLLETLEHNSHDKLSLTAAMRLLSIAYYHDLAQKHTPTPQELINSLFTK